MKKLVILLISLFIAISSADATTRSTTARNHFKKIQNHFIVNHIVRINNLNKYLMKKEAYTTCL